MEKNALEYCENADLTLVMLVLNDGVRIIPVVTTLAYTVDVSLKLIIIYDFNEDITIPVVKNLQKAFPNISLVKNNGRGVIQAIKTGFNYNKSDIVGVWVSYHVDPFGMVNKMFELVKNGCFLVSGNRFNKVKKISRGNAVKKLLSRAGNFVALKLIQVPLGDITTNVKLFRKEFLDQLTFETELTGGWALFSEITMKAAILGVKLGEVEIKPENANLIRGVSHFRIGKQLDQYLRWIIVGYKNRKIIRKNYTDSKSFIRFEA